MSAKPPPPSKIDPQLTAMADALGFTLARFKMPIGQQRYFVKDRMGNVLFNGESFEHKELVGALRGGGHHAKG